MRYGIILSVLAAAAVGLGNSGCSDQEQAQRDLDQKQKQETLAYTKARAKMMDSVPVPELKTSAERQAVARRAKTWNNEDKISYVYLLDTGRVMAFYVARGKVSSLNSYLIGGGDSTPDIDGTYGHNIEGVFFFTDAGAYVEWNGHYLCSDQPLKLAQEPLLVREVK